MSEQIFKATVRGVDDVYLLELGYKPYGYVSTKEVEGSLFHQERHVTNLRHVRVVKEGQIVLDLAIEERKEFADWLDIGSPTELATVPGARIAVKVAEQIEAQTKPERMTEPKGFGAAVEASVKEPWPDVPQPLEIHWLVQVKRDGETLWQSDHGFHYSWDDLKDPKPIREGVKA